MEFPFGFGLNYCDGIHKGTTKMIYQGLLRHFYALILILVPKLETLYDLNLGIMCLCVLNSALKGPWSLLCIKLEIHFASEIKLFSCLPSLTHELCNSTKGKKTNKSLEYDLQSLAVIVQAALSVKVPKGRRKYVREMYLAHSFIPNASAMPFIASWIFSLNWMFLSSGASVVFL